MKQLMWLLKWVLKAAIFFTLFAFALNNQHDVAVHFFFGSQWHAPVVLLVLIVFSCGWVVGALGMLPRWWNQRRAARVAAQHAQHAAVSDPLPPTPPHGL